MRIENFKINNVSFLLKYISIQFFLFFCTSFYCESCKNCESRFYDFCIFSRRPLFTHVRQLKEIFIEIDSETFLDVIRLRRKDKFLEVSEITLYQHRKVALSIYNVKRKEYARKCLRHFLG